MCITDQELAFLFILFESPPFGKADSVAAILAMQPAQRGFPVLGRLLCGPFGTDVCSQVRLYRGEPDALRSTFCTGQASSTRGPCSSCMLMHSSAMRRAVAKRNMLTPALEDWAAGKQVSITRTQLNNRTHIMQLHHLQQSQMNNQKSAASWVCLQSAHQLPLHAATLR